MLRFKEAENYVRLVGKKGRSKQWPFLLLLAASLLFFFPILLLRKLPWLLDIKTYYLPNWHYLHRALVAGGFSYWCPGIYCGFPLFADSEMGIFYPFNTLFMLLPSMVGFHLSLFLHVLLGGSFLYLYCRRLGLGRPASLFAAVPFMLGGFNFAHLVHPNIVTTLAWMPLLLYMLERYLGEKRPSFCLLAGGVLGLQFLSGFLMIPLMEIVLSLFYVYFHPAADSGRERLLALARWAAAVALALGLGMIQNLPSYHLVSQSYRAGGLSGELSNVGNLPPLQLIGLLFPRAFGQGIGQGGYIGSCTFEETYMYVGILPLLFVPAALSKNRRWPLSFFLWAGLISALLSLGNQGLLWSLVRHLPGFHVLKEPSRFFLVAEISLLILGASGFDRWVRGELSDEPRRTLTRGWAIGLGTLALVILAGSLLYRFDVLHFREFALTVSRPLLSGVKVSVRGALDSLHSYFLSLRLEHLLPLVMFALFLLALRTGGKGGVKPRHVALIIILLTADVYLISSSVLKLVPREEVEFRPSVVDVLERFTDKGRVALLKENDADRIAFPLTSNQLLPFGLEDAFGYSTIPPLRTDSYLALLDADPRPSAYALLGASTFYSHLVRVDGTPYDPGLPLTFSAGSEKITYRCARLTEIMELRLLLDGPVLSRETQGRITLMVSLGKEGGFQERTVLSLVKRAGEEYAMLDPSSSGKEASLRKTDYRPPERKHRREVLEIKVPVRRLNAEEVTVTHIFSREMAGSRLLAATAVDGEGVASPLMPWPLVSCERGYAVYGAEDSAPLAYVASKVWWAEDWRSAVETSHRRGYRKGEVVLVREEVDPKTRERLENLGRENGETEVELLERSGDHLLLRASGNSDGVLIVSQSYLPGWRGRIDGRECALFSAYGFLTALYLPAGDHTVALEYGPPGLLPGKVVTALSATVLLLLFLLIRRKESEVAGLGKGAAFSPPDRGSISAFFPCYNDAATIAEVVEKALRILPSLTRDYEVIIVDDGSTDDSGKVIESLLAAHPEIRVIRHPVNRGYGAALRSGIRASTKKWIFYTDGDGQYDVEDLLRLHPWTGVADVVNGYKEKRSDPWYRVLLGSAYNLAVRLLFRIPIRDVDCDFRLMRGDLVRDLDLRSEGGSICLELIKGLQARQAVFAEVPVRHLPRRQGRSQFFRLRNILAMAADIPAIWCRAIRKKI